MSERNYQLNRRDETGVFLGLGFAQSLLLGGGLGATIVLQLLGFPVLMAALPLAVATCVATLRIGGRVAYEWFPLVGTAGARKLLGRWTWRAHLPLLPAQAGQGAEDMPPVLRGIDIVEVGAGASRFAAVRDRRNARLTAVIPVRSQRFAGLDGSAQDALVAAWGEVLSMHAGADSPVVQIGWHHQARRSNLDSHRVWARGVSEEDAHSEVDAAEYAALVDEIEQGAVTHDTTVWLTVSGSSASGKGRLLDRAETHLPIAVTALLRTLDAAGVTASGPLPAHGLWRLLRLRSDSLSGAKHGNALSLAQRMGVLGAENGRPLAFETTWSSVRIDDAHHRTYWVESWPRRPVPAAWLAPFLGRSESTSMTVIYRPIDPGRSHRRIDGQLVKLTAHRARKDEKAKRVTEVERRTEQAVHELEAELAAGYVESLYLGLITVTAGTTLELDERCHLVEQAARAAQMGLRVLHGQQDVAWAAALPFGLTEPGLLDLVGL